MGTTPNHALPYPEPADLVAQAPAAVRALAEATATALDAVAAQAASRILTGTVTAPNDGTKSTRTVTFPVGWLNSLEGDQPPRIALAVTGDAVYHNRPYVAVARDITTDGLTIDVYPIQETGTGTITGGDVVVHWTAVKRVA